jgi:hypothetical protein
MADLITKQLDSGPRQAERFLRRLADRDAPR